MEYYLTDKYISLEETIISPIDIYINIPQAPELIVWALNKGLLLFNGTLVPNDGHKGIIPLRVAIVLARSNNICQSDIFRKDLDWCIDK